MTVTLDNQIQAWLTAQNKTGANPTDYYLVDHLDGNGPQIGYWNAAKLGPQPTADQLTSVTTQAQTIATQQLMNLGELAIQNWLDQTAQSYGYDHIISACSYKGSTVDLWNRQGTAFVSWRDSVWQAAIKQENAVKAGTEQPPATVADLIASLPQPAIPTS